MLLRRTGLSLLVNASADRTDSDKRRLAIYYLIDWILRRGHRPFTFVEVIAAWSVTEAGHSRGLRERGLSASQLYWRRATLNYFEIWQRRR